MVARGATVSVKCKCCGDPFTARVADRTRGWARFCSKSCKARHQERRTGQNARYHERQAERDDDLRVTSEDCGFDVAIMDSVTGPADEWR